MHLLQELASANETGKRRDLLRQVASLFLLAEKQGLEEQQTDLFGEVMVGLLKKAATDERLAVAERIADSAGAPKAVVMRMATDDIEVAAPVLERSPVLSEDDLITISRESTTSHRVSLSRRENLSGRVTDELISHHETEVMRTVTENRTAEITERSFATLAQHSAEDAQLRARLIERKDMPVEVARDVLPLLDEGERKTLLQMMEDGGHKLADLVALAKVETSKQKIQEHRRRIEAKSFASDIEMGLKTLDEVTLALADERRPRCLAVVMSRLNKMPETQVYHAILGTSGQLLALMCRANNIGFDAFAATDDMRRDLLRLPMGSNHLEREEYEALDAGEAQRAIRFAKTVNAARS